MAILFAAGTPDWLQHDAAVVGNYPFTLACWFYPTDTTNTGTLVSITSSSSSQGRHRIVYAGGVATDPVQIFSNASSATSTAGTSVDTWNHACGVFTSQTSRTIYLNGGNSATNTGNVAIGTNDRTSIGRNITSAPTTPFTGRIGEVAIWDVALTADEVNSLARGTPPDRIRPANLVAYWPIYHTGYLQNVWRGGFAMSSNGTPSTVDHAPAGTMGFIYRNQLYVPYAASGAQTISVTQVSETDTSQALTRLKVLAIGQPAESDLSQAITARKTVVVTQANESDLAQAIAWAPKHRFVSQVAENDIAGVVSFGFIVGVAQTLETDLAQAITAKQNPLIRVVGQASDSELAQAITVVGGEVAAPLGTVPIRYVAEGPNVVPVQTVGVGGIDIVPCREEVGPANVVPVYEAGDTKNNRVKVVLV